MDSTYSLQEMNGLLFDLFISSSTSSSKNSNNSLLDDKTQVDPCSEIEEPSLIEIVEDSLLSSNKGEADKTMISIHSTSEVASFSKSDISLKDISYQSFLSNTIPALSTDDIEQIFNEESMSNPTFSGNDINESTNEDNVKELNDQISRRFLRECLNLPEILYACLQRCIFCSYYDNQSIFPILCADYKHFYQDYIHGNSNEDVAFYLISSNKLNISHEDLLFFLSSMIPLIPSLTFLLDNSSLFDIYITTVAYIIEFRIGHSQSYITKSQFKASHFLQSLYNIIAPSIDRSYDPYFSYEATYVLWTLFQHLDTDQDSFLSLNELRRYDDMSFTELTLHQILMMKGHYDIDKKEYVLNYPEFIHLVIANENRRTKESIYYWFDILDLNMTGLIDETCIYSFYKSQKARLLEYSIESPTYELYCASIYDLLNCKGRSISLSDLLPTDADLQVAVFQKSVAIDMMVNTVRFLKFEHRDPSRQNEFDYDNPVYCDWKSFISYFYDQFVYEEEPSSQVD